LGCGKLGIFQIWKREKNGRDLIKEPMKGLKIGIAMLGGALERRRKLGKDLCGRGSMGIKSFSQLG